MRLKNSCPSQSQDLGRRVSSLIGYGHRLWFVNSVKYADHNSADVYSYDPASGAVRYEGHLFSQDAGDPVVFRDLLFWPFEDARFSAGHGEYMMTNGHGWQWHIMPEGQVFHIHAMVVHQGALIAATGACSLDRDPPVNEFDTVDQILADSSNDSRRRTRLITGLESLVQTRPPR